MADPTTNAAVFATGTGPTQDLTSQAQSFVTTRWDLVKNAYTSYHQQAFIAFLMYAGQMWIRWDNTKKIYVSDTPEDDFVPTPQINRFSPACDAVASNFNAVPELEWVARENDDSQKIEIAGIANDLSDYCLEECGLSDDSRNDNDKAGLAGQLLVLAGGVFTEVWMEQQVAGQTPVTEPQDMAQIQCPNCDTYDKMPQQQLPSMGMACPSCGMGLQIDTVTEHVPVLDEISGEPLLEPIYAYKPRVRICNPVNAFPRPGATSMANTPYFIWAERWSLEEIRQRLGDDVDVSADSIMPDGWSQQLEQQLQYFYQGFMSGIPKSQDSAMLLRIIILPKGQNNPGVKDFPEGLDCWYAGQKVIKAEVFSEKDSPFTKADYLKIPTTFFGRSVAFDLANIQREINGYESLIKLHAQSASCEPICVDEAMVVEGGVTNRGDKVIRYRAMGPGATPPYRLTHEALSPIIMEKLQALHQEMENISGAVSVFRGQQEGGITAASAISQLRGQAELMFSKPVNNWNGLWKETMFKLLHLLQKYWSLDDVLAVVGQKKIQAAQEFLQCELTATLKIVSTQHGLPRTRDERRQEMMQLFDAGALDVSDISVREKLFELFGETGMFKTFNADATRARAENRLMQMGQQVEFRPEVEDLKTHADIHLETIKDLAFEKLDQGAQQLMLEHYMMTQQAMMPPPIPPPGPPPAPSGKSNIPQIPPQPPPA